MPMGRSWRIEVFHEPTQMWRGESHLMAWERILRYDPCAFCGAAGGTVDHIIPRCLGLPLTNSWTNIVGSCQRCNERKSAKALLAFLWAR